MGLTTTEDARRTLAELEAKLAAATAREIELANEARRISYSALSDGNEADKKALAKIDAEEVKLRLTQKHLRDAIDEGRSRVRAAEVDEERGRLREVAGEVLAHAETAAARGPRIRDLADGLCSEITAAISDVRFLNHRGAPVINERSFRLAMTRTILPLLREAGLEVELIAPGQRSDPEALVSGYTNRAAEWAAPFLAKAKAA